MTDKPMDEMAAFTKMWIAFHESRPTVGLAWFVQHYRDGELVDFPPSSAPSPAERMERRAN